jgi:hypothetical protein
MGCSQEKGQPVQEQNTAPVTSNQKFEFRGIKMGVPVESQFKPCREGMAEACTRKYERLLYAENLPPLEIFTNDPVLKMTNGKVTEIEVAFNNNDFEKMVLLMKGKYGQYHYMVSEVKNELTTKGQRVRCETVTMEWNVKGYGITLDGANALCPCAGHIIIKSPELSQPAEQKKGNYKNDKKRPGFVFHPSRATPRTRSGSVQQLCVTYGSDGHRNSLPSWKRRKER